MSGAVFVKTFAPPPISEADVLRYARCPSADAGTIGVLRQCAQTVRDLFTYSVCYTETPVRIEGGVCRFSFGEIRSADLARHLEGCGKAVLFAATVGLKAEMEMRKAAVKSPVRALFMDAIGTERIEALCDAFENEIRRFAAAQRREIRPRFSPGYGDLPLETQRVIFTVLDCPRRIGLSLTENCMMTPSKSVTAFIGVT